MRRGIITGWTFVLAACASSSTIAPVEPAPPRTPEVAPSEPAPAPVMRPPGATPVRVPIDDVASLSVGGEHACVARTDGHVWCWGNGDTFRLGNGVIASSKRPLEVAGVADAARVSAGGTMSCAIQRDGAVVCWGGYRQRPGDGDDDGIAWPMVRLPEKVAYPVAWTRQVSAGWVQAALLDASGGVGLLDAYLGPVPLTAFAPARAIAALNDGFCALGQDGGVQCVTSSESGANGNAGGGGGYGEDPSQVLKPIVWSDALRPVFIDDENETRWAPCWDPSAPENEGVDPPDEGRRPVPPLCKETMRGALALDAHEDLACAVMADHTLACWGCAACWSEGRPPLGMPAELHGVVPVLIPGVRDVAQVAVGGRHLCTLHRDGAVRCWGDDTFAQLGPNAHGASATPVEVPGLGEVAAIDAGDATTCALRKDHSVVCWGHALGTYQPYWPDQRSDPDEGEAPATTGPLVTERTLTAADLAGEAAASAVTEACREVDVFDREGELLEVRYKRDAKGQAVEEQRAWWKDGKLLPPHETWRYRYDRAGNAVRQEQTEVREDGTTHTSRWDLRYDKNGNVTRKKGRDTVDDSAYTFVWDAKGRLLRATTSWGPDLKPSWRERPGPEGTPLAGLTVHEAIAEYELDGSMLPWVTRYAEDAQGRRVYERTASNDDPTTETWTSYDAAGDVVLEREATFRDPFYEDPDLLHEDRTSYDASGRVSKVERFAVEVHDGKEVLVPKWTKVYLYSGCL